MNDIEFALRLQANDNGIYDEELIQTLFEEYKKSNFNDIKDFLGNTFDTFEDNSDELSDEFEFSSANPTYANKLNDLMKFVREIEFEPMNDQAQRTATQNYNSRLFGQSGIQSPFPNGAHAFTSFLDSMIDPFPTFTPSFQLHAPPMRMGIGGFGGFAGMGSMGTPNFTQFAGSIGNILTTALNGNFDERVPVTLTDDALNKITDISYDDAKTKINLPDDEQCSICQDLLKNDKDNHLYNILPCNHVFHSVCIKEGLKEYDYHCPICREPCGEHKPKLDGNNNNHNDHYHVNFFEDDGDEVEDDGNGWNCEKVD